MPCSSQCRGRVLTVAYGSNMDWEQMRTRCPSARFVGVANLPKHRLAFTRRSESRGCGVADAVPDDDREVWGVVYEIDSRDVGSLDASEGFRPGRATNAYRRAERHVFVDGKESRPLTVSIYFAEPQDDPPPPNSVYKALILSGTRHWHLPGDYIHELEQIEVAD